jgi:hypothetical protein
MELFTQFCNQERAVRTTNGDQAGKEGHSCQQGKCSISWIECETKNYKAMITKGRFRSVFCLVNGKKSYLVLTMRAVVVSRKLYPNLDANTPSQPNQGSDRHIPQCNMQHTHRKKSHLINGENGSHHHSPRPWKDFNNRRPTYPHYPLPHPPRPALSAPAP